MEIEDFGFRGITSIYVNEYECDLVATCRSHKMKEQETTNVDENDVTMFALCRPNVFFPSSDILFPFGVGDSSLPRGIDVYSEIQVPMPFPFFGQNFTSVFVSSSFF